MNSKTEERKYELESTKLKLKLLSLASEALTEWTFHSEKNGIQLYVKPTSSSIDIAQVVTRIDKPVDQLATFLFDTAKVRIYIFFTFCRNTQIQFDMKS